MNATLYYLNRIQDWMSAAKFIDFLAPLLLRLYLGPIFVFAGWKKISGIENTIAWFGNAEWGLGLPFPDVLAWMAAGTEFFGGMLLIVGVAVRWVSIPLMITMLVAASTHWSNGWQAIADPNWLFANEKVTEAATRLSAAKDILKEHGNYAWLTGRGSLVVLNNGIEFAATYFLMLLALLSIGGGRYFSLDYWLAYVFRDIQDE